MSSVSSSVPSSVSSSQQSATPSWTGATPTTPGVTTSASSFDPSESPERRTKTGPSASGTEPSASGTERGAAGAARGGGSGDDEGAALPLVSEIDPMKALSIASGVLRAANQVRNDRGKLVDPSDEELAEMVFLRFGPARGAERRRAEEFFSGQGRRDDTGSESCRSLESSSCGGETSPDCELSSTDDAPGSRRRARPASSWVRNAMARVLAATTGGGRTGGEEGGGGASSLFPGSRRIRTCVRKSEAIERVVERLQSCADPGARVVLDPGDRKQNKFLWRRHGVPFANLKAFDDLLPIPALSILRDLLDEEADLDESWSEWFRRKWQEEGDGEDGEDDEDEEPEDEVGFVLRKATETGGVLLEKARSWLGGGGGAEGGADHDEAGETALAPEDFSLRGILRSIRNRRDLVGRKGDRRIFAYELLPLVLLFGRMALRRLRGDEPENLRRMVSAVEFYLDRFEPLGLGIQQKLQLAVAAEKLFFGTLDGIEYVDVKQSGPIADELAERAATLPEEEGGGREGGNATARRRGGPFARFKLRDGFLWVAIGTLAAMGASASAAPADGSGGSGGSDLSRAVAAAVPASEERSREVVRGFTEGVSVERAVDLVQVGPSAGLPAAFCFGPNAFDPKCASPENRPAFFQGEANGTLPYGDLFEAIEKRRWSAPFRVYIFEGEMTVQAFGAILQQVEFETESGTEIVTSVKPGTVALPLGLHAGMAMNIIASRAKVNGGFPEDIENSLTWVANKKNLMPMAWDVALHLRAIEQSGDKAKALATLRQSRVRLANAVYEKTKELFATDYEKLGQVRDLLLSHLFHEDPEIIASFVLEDPMVLRYLDESFSLSVSSAIQREKQRYKARVQKKLRETEGGGASVTTTTAGGKYPGEVEYANNESKEIADAAITSNLRPFSHDTQGLAKKRKEAIKEYLDLLGTASPIIADFKDVEDMSPESELWTRILKRDYRKLPFVWTSPGKAMMQLFQQLMKTEWGGTLRSQIKNQPAIVGILAGYIVAEEWKSASIEGITVADAALAIFDGTLESQFLRPTVVKVIGALGLKGFPLEGDDWEAVRKGLFLALKPAFTSQSSKYPGSFGAQVSTEINAMESGWPLFVARLLNRIQALMGNTEGILLLGFVGTLVVGWMVSQIAKLFGGRSSSDRAAAAPSSPPPGYGRSRYDKDVAKAHREYGSRSRYDAASRSPPPSRSRRQTGGSRTMNFLPERTTTRTGPYYGYS